MILNFTTFR